MRWLVTAVLLAGATAAQAQTPPGQFDSRPVFADRLTATQRIVSCLVVRNRQAAADYARAVGREQIDIAWTHLRATAINCLHDGSLTMQAVEIQGSIAEALLLADDEMSLNAVAAEPPVPVIRLTRITSPRFPTGLFACVADSAPAKAAAVLRTAPGSGEEAERIGELGPAMQACVPFNTELHIGPSGVRVLLALALFRMADAARGAR